MSFRFLCSVSPLRIPHRFLSVSSHLDLKFRCGRLVSVNLDVMHVF